MKYLVLQSFVSNDVVGTKNGYVTIQNEEFAKSLMDAKIISKIGNKETNIEKDKVIAKLNTTISLLNTKLKAENEELVKKINSFEKISSEDNELENESSKENLENEQVNDNLDDKSILNTENN